MPDELPPMFHPVWWRVNAGLDQQGPGSDATTQRALDALPELPRAPRIADMGCGPGRQSLVLARATGGSIVGLDLLPPFLERARSRARDAGLSDRLHFVQADMARPPFPDAAFDLVWSEGAVYIPGFEAGLSRWRRMLRPGGLAAVTELTWVGEPPTEIREFWIREYPEMADVATNCERAKRAGFDVLEHFDLPMSDWNAYLDPIAANIAELRAEYAEDPAACRVFESQDEEIEILARSAGSYTYVFYLLQRSS